ncbi:MAG: transporter [Oscillospiraceae bacterium]|nr:transporter [Oscillospiraceae bacterium]
MNNKGLKYLTVIANAYEIVVACLLLIVIAIKIFEMISGLAGFQIELIAMDFDRILSLAFALVIGVELTKMLVKHTPESVIDVLVFATARQTIMYHQRKTDMLIGIIAIAGLFATKKFLLNKKDDVK